jgi:hypothetical protein
MRGENGYRGLALTFNRFFEKHHHLINVRLRHEIHGLKDPNLHVHSNPPQMPILIIQTRFLEPTDSVCG